MLREMTLFDYTLCGMTWCEVTLYEFTLCDSTCDEHGRARGAREGRRALNNKNPNHTDMGNNK